MTEPVSTSCSPLVSLNPVDHGLSFLHCCSNRQMGKLRLGRLKLWPEVLLSRSRGCILYHSLSPTSWPPHRSRSLCCSHPPSTMLSRVPRLQLASSTISGMSSAQESLQSLLSLEDRPWKPSVRQRMSQKSRKPHPH